MTPNTPETNTQETAPEATGIASKLTDAQKEMLARKSRGGGGAGWQSTGKGHKPTHTQGKQAKTEKKVRW
ncbi:hypothetical protein [Arthrobacter sp. NyZ413]|uniref:hypothetical protein n=1 Tax=Arthrobacter sp. NyZ413 TaxID=3144669 RepID=UPI003BF8BDA4